MTQSYTQPDRNAYAELIAQINSCRNASEFGNMFFNMANSVGPTQNQVLQRLLMSAIDRFVELSASGDKDGNITATIMGRIGDARFNIQFYQQLLSKAGSPTQYREIIESVSTTFLNVTGADVNGAVRNSLPHFFEMNPSNTEAKALRVALKSQIGFFDLLPC